MVLILSIFIYRVATYIGYSNTQQKITTSKYTGERIHNFYSDKSAKIATYTNVNNEPAIVGLSSADVVLEFLSSTHGITYKAIFNQDSAKSVSNSIDLDEYSNTCLPRFNFADDIEGASIMGKDTTSIFITFNEDSSSNFLYENGEYYHYKGLFIDKDNNMPIKFSNVIVQFISDKIISDESLISSKNYGTGLLFHSGKVQNIKWSRDKGSEMKVTDQEGDKISLVTGTTWWIIINKDCSVAYD